MVRFVVLITLALVVASPWEASAWADGKSKLAQEAAEAVLARFGRGAVKEGTQALARRIEVAAARHGPEMFQAVKSVGPRAITLAEGAGAQAARAARVMATHGEAGATWVVARPNAMKFVAQHGEQASAVLVKHAGGIAEPVVARFGAPAIRALEAAGPQAGRRVSMMAADGTLARIGRCEEVLEVCARYGDRAVKFVWENKGALAVGAGLTAFLANPEPFISGAKDIAAVVGENLVRPVATEAAKGVSTAVTVLLVAAGMVVLMVVGVWVARLAPVPPLARPSLPAPTPTGLHPEGGKTCVSPPG